jgi:hypothetical protein
MKALPKHLELLFWKKIINGLFTGIYMKTKFANIFRNTTNKTSLNFIYAGQLSSISFKLPRGPVRAILYLFAQWQIDWSTMHFVASR